MNAGWQTERLGEVATLQRGFDLPVQDRVSGDVPVVSSSGAISHHNEFRVGGPGVVTGRSGSIGKVFMIEDAFWPLNTVLYVKDFHGNCPRFVYYLLKRLDLRQFASGTGVPTLNRNTVHEELVSVPPLDEQKRIVAKLDEAFAGIDTAKANAQANQEHSDATFKSRLSSLFPLPNGGTVNTAWEAMRIRDVASVRGGKRLPKGHKLTTTPTGHPYITVSDFSSSGSVSEEKIQYLEPDTYNQISRYTISSADLYISIAGTIGKSGVVPESLDGSNLTENACKLVLTDSVIQRFLYYFTISDSFTTQAKDSTRVAAQPKLALHRIAEMEIPVPPIFEQRRIVSILDELRVETDRLRSTFVRIGHELDDLAQSILHQAFAGQL